MDTLLQPADDNGKDNTERQIISRVISAAIGDKSPNDSISKPVTFTLRTWNVSYIYIGSYINCH